AEARLVPAIVSGCPAATRRRGGLVSGDTWDQHGSHLLQGAVADRGRHGNRGVTVPAFHTVVVGVHEGMPAKSIQLTASLACESGAKLILVAAYRAGGGAANTFEVAGPAQNALDKAAMMCAEFGHHDVETYAVPGDPVEALTDAVSEHHADLLVVGSRGLAGVRDRLLGSVPGNLTRQ